MSLLLRLYFELGYELCGSYSLPANEESYATFNTDNGTTYSLNPLTSVKKLAAFVPKCLVGMK